MISKDPLTKLTITVVAEDSVAYESPYLGQHGVSFLLTAQHGSTLKHILVDVAQNPAALVQNIHKMQLSLSCVDFVVLTHCHYDHTQGLARVLREIGKTDMPVVAHPDIFRLNFITDPFLRHVGIMDGDKQPDIEASGGTLYLTKDPLQLLPGIFSTGEVERTTDFEDPGMSLFTIENDRLTHDPMLDDISLVANIKGKGLVVITGCSHAGIVKSSPRQSN